MVFPSAWGVQHNTINCGGLNNKHAFVTILDAGNLRWGCQDGHLMRGLSWLKMGDFSLYPHVTEYESSLGLFNKGTNTIYEGSTLMI